MGNYLVLGGTPPRTLYGGQEDAEPQSSRQD